MMRSGAFLKPWRKSSYSNEQGGVCIEVATWRTSSHSGPEGGDCIELAPGWRKSSHSGTQGGECIEVAGGGRLVLARDSKDPEGAVLAFSPAEWAAFTVAIKDGEIKAR